jgi:hypothetical protein
MKSHAGVVIGIVLSAIIGGATFLFALYRQFALVEVAASITTGGGVVSSEFVDWGLDRKETASEFGAIADCRGADAGSDFVLFHRQDAVK